MNEENQELFKSIKGIMVIQGKHLRFNAHHKAFVKGKEYNWRVDSGTHNIKNAKVSNIATVKDIKNSKNMIVITKIIHAKGSAAIKMAKHLKYVINFQNNRFSNHSIISNKK